jgi:hypothetical protein
LVASWSLTISIRDMPPPQVPLEVEMRTPQGLRKGSNQSRCETAQVESCRRTERFDAGTSFGRELTQSRESVAPPTIIGLIPSAKVCAGASKSFNQHRYRHS